MPLASSSSALASPTVIVTTTNYTVEQNVTSVDISNNLIANISARQYIVYYDNDDYHYVSRESYSFGITIGIPVAVGGGILSLIVAICCCRCCGCCCCN